MAEITLSTKECLAAAAKAGARNFFGLPNPFWGMSAEAIQREIGELQLSMEKKGCAEVGFDDVFVLKPETAELIGLCTNCDSYLLAQFLLPEEPEKQLVLYAGQGGFAHAHIRGSDVTLGRLEEDALLPTLLEEIGPPAAGDAPESQTQIRQSDLAGAKDLAIDDAGAAARQLMEQGCPEAMAQVLVQSFRHEAARCVFFRTDLQKRRLTQMLAFQSGDGAVCMTLEDAQEDLWNAQYLPQGLTADVLAALCPRKGAGDEVR